jgi:hypothetical protein
LDWPPRAVGSTISQPISAANISATAISSAATARTYEPVLVTWPMPAPRPWGGPPQRSGWSGAHSPVRPHPGPSLARLPTRAGGSPACGHGRNEQKFGLRYCAAVPVSSSRRNTARRPIRADRAPPGLAAFHVDEAAAIESVGIARVSNATLHSSKFARRPHKLEVIIWPRCVQSPPGLTDPKRQPIIGVEPPTSTGCTVLRQL